MTVWGEISTGDSQGSWCLVEGGNLAAETVEELTPAESAVVTAALLRYRQVKVRGADGRVLRHYTPNDGRPVLDGELKLT